MERKILLPPDAYHLWALMPDILLNYDKVIVDKTDYGDCQTKSDESTYNLLVAQATKQYLQEGFIELRDLRGLIGSSELNKFNQFANEAVAKESQSVRRFGAQMFQHWVQFCDSRIMFYSHDEPAFKHIGSDKRKAVWILNSIRNTGRPPDESDFYRIVQLNVTKALVAMYASARVGIPYHDLATLKPAIQLIAYHFSEQGQYELPKFEEGKNPSDQPLVSLYKMASTGTLYDSPSCIRQIVSDRQGFVAYRSALRELDSLYHEIKKATLDDEVAHKKLEVELLRIRELIDEELNMIRKEHKVLLFVIDLLSSFYVPFLSKVAELLEPKAKEKALDRSISKQHPQYMWFYAFQKLLRKRPGKLAISKKFQTDARHSSWCAGHVPWYSI